VRSKHATLTTTAVDTVTLTGSFAKVEIINKDAAVAMYANVNFRGVTATTVSDALDDSYVIPANGVLSLKASGADFNCSLIGNGNAYSVVGYDNPGDGVAFTGAAAA
jgi:hypothetical protein